MRDCDAEMCPMWDGDGCPCEEFDLDRADADTDVPRLVGALRAVLELHKDDRFDRRHGRSFCAECLQDDGMPVPYPCPTVTAITIELERHL